MKARLPLVLLLLGAAARVAATFPIHAYPADSDSLLAGQRAFLILDGHFPVFFVTVRIGAFEIYMHALAFLAFGASRASLALAPLLSGCALLLVFHLFSRLLLDRPASNLALLFMALPAPAVLFWTYMPNSYVETMLFCAAMLWLAERLRQHPDERISWLGFGLASGLGWWNSLLSLSCLLPALVWLAWGRAFRRRTAVLAAAGFVIGAFPWLAYNVRHPLATFRDNFAVRPSTNLSDIGSNAAYVLTYGLPELVASIDPENGANPPTPLQKALRAPALAVHAAALLFAAGLAFTVLRRRAAERSRRGPPSPVLLLLLVVATSAGLAIFSEAGQTRGLTVRYVLPLYLAVPGLLALFLAAISRRTRAGAAVLAAVVLVFNVSGYFLPGMPARRLWEHRKDADDRLVEFLKAGRIDAVCGSYWITNPVNFLSREKIRAIPCEDHPDFDPYRIAARLPAAPLRWALFSRTPGNVEAWARNAGLTGAVTALAGDAFVFVPAANPPPGPTAPEFLVRLRRSVPGTPP